MMGEKRKAKVCNERKAKTRHLYSNGSSNATGECFLLDFWVRPKDRLDHRKKDYFILRLIYNHCIEEKIDEN